jgi:hypothetical protein
MPDALNILGINRTKYVGSRRQVAATIHKYHQLGVEKYQVHQSPDSFTYQ